MLGLWKRKLKEEYSIIDSTGDYKGAWLRSIPKNPSELYRYCLGIENLQTGKKMIAPIQKIFYYGNNVPHFELRALDFKKGGLVAEVVRIKDISGQNQVIHFCQNLRFKNKDIVISRKRFTN